MREVGRSRWRWCRDGRASCRFAAIWSHTRHPEPPPRRRCQRGEITAPAHWVTAMKFLSRLFGGKGDDTGHEPPSMPWDRRPSILEFVCSHIPTGGPGVDEGGYTPPMMNVSTPGRSSAGGWDRWTG